MASSLTMSMASLSVAGAGRGATMSRAGVATRAPVVAKGGVGGSAFFATPKSASKMTMSSSLAGEFAKQNFWILGCGRDTHARDNHSLACWRRGAVVCRCTTFVSEPRASVVSLKDVIFRGRNKNGHVAFLPKKTHTPLSEKRLTSLPRNLPATRSLPRCRDAAHGGYAQAHLGTWCASGGGGWPLARVHPAR
jgi:hypothetical protein